MDQSAILEKSVAPIVSGDGSIKGSAFLFRKEKGTCFWFTCHHVIAPLEALQIGERHEGSNGLKAVKVEYIEEESNPEKDIAVLRSDEGSFRSFLPLPMGDVGPHLKNSPFEVTGIAFSPGQMQNFVSGRIFHATLTQGQEIEFRGINRDDEFKGIDVPINPWNVFIDKFKVRCFNFVSSNVDIQGGYSGSPLCVYGKDQKFICVGMVNQRSLQNNTRGTAIAFEELFSTANALIPFYDYSGCVVIVVAATRDEMLQHEKTTRISKILNGSSVYENYGKLDRNEWIAFDTRRSVHEVLREIETQSERKWQIATAYLDDYEGRELEEYLINPKGALLFIVDSLSIDIQSLSSIVAEADRQYHRATYLFPICEKRFFNPDSRENIRDHIKPYLNHLARASIGNYRTEECAHEVDFRKRFLALIDSAIVQSEAIRDPRRISERLQLSGISFGNPNIPMPRITMW